MNILKLHYILIQSDNLNSNLDVALTSDFIVGFCGETEEDHRDTVSLIEQVKFHYVYQFPYSMRQVQYFGYIQV